MVEDGTGEAQVYVYDDLVPTILKLNCQQWLNLQDLAMRNGELLYQRHWRCGNRDFKVKNVSKPSMVPFRNRVFAISNKSINRIVVSLRFLVPHANFACVTAKAENFAIKE